SAKPCSDWPAACAPRLRRCLRYCDSWSVIGFWLETASGARHDGLASLLVLDGFGVYPRAVLEPEVRGKDAFAVLDVEGLPLDRVADCVQLGQNFLGLYRFRPFLRCVIHSHASRRMPELRQVEPCGYLLAVHNLVDESQLQRLGCV